MDVNRTINPAVCYLGNTATFNNIAVHFSASVIAAFLISATLVAFVLWAPHGLSQEAAVTFLLTGLAIVGWTLTPIPDSVVAISAALGLVLTGALPEERFYAALGTELIWLLISAFVIAAAVKTSGLTERFADKVTRRFTTAVGLFHALAFVISITVFLIPSTSGRAALLLPVFLSLAPAMPTLSLRRALALLFPSAILLSAGGSLIGAGAHFIAVEAIRSSTGQSISFIDWIMLALPVAFIATHGATFLILLLFVPAKERKLQLQVQTAGTDEEFTSKQKRLLCLLAALVTAWVTTGMHGVDIALIGCVGAALIVTPLFTHEKPKVLFRNVETELLVFLASTWVIAQAVVSTGKAKWFADNLLNVLPIELLQHREFVILVAIGIAVVAHLAINSRSARAAVLIPSLALPLAEFGHDTVTLVMATVLGTGYCQSMIASAKPIAIFKSAAGDHFDQNDLIKLAVPLLPLKFGVIACFAVFVWPYQTQPAPSEAGSLTSPQSPMAQTSTGSQAFKSKADDNLPVMPGALCTRRELETLILGTIYEKHMWAAGWWHVWDRLRKDNVPVEKSAVREIYRSQNMVQLRSHSPRFAKINLKPKAFLEAKVTCSGQLMDDRLALGSSPPIPRAKP